MAQYEDLDILGAIAPTSQHQQIEYEADKTVETCHGPILAASEPALRAPAKPHVNLHGRVSGTDRLGRAHSVGHQRQTLNLLGYALMTNSLTRARNGPALQQAA